MERMELFNAVADTIGNLAAVVAAIGVLFVNAKLDRLTGRVNEQGETLRTHVNSPGLHRGL